MENVTWSRSEERLVLPVTAARYAPHTANVASEIVDGVAILINLSTGTYYSMEQTAATIWLAITEERTVPGMISALTAAYEVTPAQAATDTDRLLTELLAEGLILAQPAGQSPAEVPDPLATSVPGDTRQPYQPPVLDIFRDLSPLLADDPPVLIRRLPSNADR
jgi:hypothetical protein